MKILIVFYSRTGTTKKVAEILAKHLSAELEEILTTDRRLGFFGYLNCGREATFKISPQIQTIKNNPADYDLMIIGTPVWAFSMASPVRTYLDQNKEKMRRIGFFCTMGSSGAERTFAEMQKICNHEPLAVLVLTTVEVAKNNIEEKVVSWLKDCLLKKQD
jgi:flavodoxin